MFGFLKKDKVTETPADGASTYRSYHGWEWSLG